MGNVVVYVLLVVVIRKPIMFLDVFMDKLKNNKILMESSSGGAFSAISELWIKNGGVVWGIN